MLSLASLPHLRFATALPCQASPYSSFSEWPHVSGVIRAAPSLPSPALWACRVPVLYAPRHPFQGQCPGEKLGLALLGEKCAL